MAGRATKSISLFLVSLACVLCFALPAAFAQDGSDDGAVLQATQPDAVLQAEHDAQAGVEASDDLQHATLELHLIQRGANPSADTRSSGGMSLGAQTASDEQIEALKARLNNGLANVEEAISVIDLRIYPEDINLLDILSDVVNSNPDLFYVNSSVSCSAYKNGPLIEIQPSYTFEKDRVLELKAEYETALQRMLSWVPDNATNVQKAKAIHDWLVRNCSYNTDAANADHPENYINGWRPWTAYGAIVDKSPVCQGYSLAFIAAMGRLGVQATYVADESHGWNRVLVDGSWFNLDVTHDDPLPDRGFYSTPLTTYFLKSDAWFKANPSDGHHVYWSPWGVPGTDTRYDSYTGTSWASLGLVHSAPAPHTAVTSFSLSETFLIVAPDSFGKIDIVDVQPSAASIYAAAWTSSNPSVVTVDSTGKVCAGASRGIATVTCTIDGASRSCAVQVHNGDITADEVTVTLEPSSFEYDGSTHQPQVSVQFFDGSQLVRDFQEGVDYSLAWPADTTNAGEKVVVVQGLEGFAGSVEATYTVKRASISTATVDIDDQSYTGTALTPAPRIQLGDTVLQAGVDYALSYANNVNAGTARVVVSGRGNYSGTVSGTFAISPVPFSDVTVASIPTQVYCGSPIDVAIAVSYGDKTLVEDKDYWALRSEVVDAGTYMVMLSGMGNFTGSRSMQFTIVPKSIADSTVSVDAIPAQAFTGSAIAPAPVLSDAQTGQALAEGVDYTLTYYDNTNAGMASIAITGKGNYDQARRAYFTIVSDGQSGNPGGQNDDPNNPGGQSGNPDNPERQNSAPTISARDVSVCVGAQIDLLEGVVAQDAEDGDITSKLVVSPRVIPVESAGTHHVAYSVADSAGAQVTKTVAITVREHNWDGGAVTLAPTCESNGVKTYTCKACGSVRTKAVQALGHSFTSYASNGDATCTKNGTKTARCDHGCGTTSTVADPGTTLGHVFTSYTSDRNATCEADGTKTAKCDHGCGATNTVTDKGSALGHSWNNGVITTPPTELSRGICVYTCKTCGATQRVTVPKLTATTSKSTSTASKSTATTQKPTVTSLVNASISGLSATRYSGKTVTPRLVVKIGGKTLKEGADYTVTFANNTKVGKATVTVSGIGSYTGSKRASFAITKASNKAKVAKKSVKKSVKAKTLKKKTLKISLPKVTTAFGKAKWKVVTKDKKRVLSLKGNKVKVKKGAKKAKYVLKLKAYVAGTANYAKATSKTVTVKVTVK